MVKSPLSPRTALVASCTLAGVLALGCKSRAYNANIRDTGAAKGSKDTAQEHDLNGPSFKGSPAFKETMEFRTPASPVRYVPLTQCELFVWAEADVPNWEIEPEALAQVWKDAEKAGRKYVSETEMPIAKNPKKKVSFAEAHAQIEAYLRYKDKDGHVLAENFARRAWVQGVINYAQGRVLRPLGGTADVNIGPYKGTNLERTPGVAFSPEALAECRAYVNSIGSSGRLWGSEQHVIADYLAATAFKKKPSPSGADGVAAYDELATSDLVDRVPFFSVVGSLPDPGIGTYDPAKDTRRYVVPTLSFRTMKALGGFLDIQGHTKAAQDIAVKALCFFSKPGNRLNDYRLDNPPPSWNEERAKWDYPPLDPSKWVGGWEERPPHVASIDLKSAAKDTSWDEAKCAKLTDEDYAKPFKPLP